MPQPTPERLPWVENFHRDGFALMPGVFAEAELLDLAEHLFAMRGGEQLRQRGFDFIAKINVNAGGGVSFLFHAAEIKPRNALAGEKISREDGEGINLRNNDVVCGEKLALNNRIQLICSHPFHMTICES